MAIRGWQPCIMSEFVPPARRTRRGHHASRLLVVAGVTVGALSPQIGDADAAASFEGEWTGSAIATKGGCKPAPAALTVSGEDVTGRATFEHQAQDIHGTVRADGTFGATIGFNPLTGQFSDGTFEGTFSSAGCEWKMILKIKRKQ